MTPDQRRQFLEQQRLFQDLQQSTTQTRPPVSVIMSLPVGTLQFDGSSPSLIRPSAVRASVDSTLLSSLATSVAPQTESTVVAMEAATSSTPTTLAVPSYSPTERTTSTSSDDEVDLFYAAPSTTTPPRE